MGEEDRRHHQHQNRDDLASRHKMTLCRGENGKFSVASLILCATAFSLISTHYILYSRNIFHHVLNLNEISEVPSKGKGHIDNCTYFHTET